MTVSNNCIEWINNGSFRKIGLQFSEDFKKTSVATILKLKKLTNTHSFIIDDVTLINCCSNLHCLNYMSAEACLHFGYTCYNNINLSTYYSFFNQNLDIEIFVTKFQNYFEDKNEYIILFYDSTLTDIIDKIYNNLKNSYENLVLSQLDQSSNVYTNNKLNDSSCIKILGRSYKLPDNHCPEMYDAVYLGQKSNTLMILSMSIPCKKWHYFHENEFHDYNFSKLPWYKTRSYLIEKIRDSQTFGLIIASLNIEDFLKISQYLKSSLEKLNKKVYMICIEKITPSKLANFQEVDIFVSIACPENSIYDSKEFSKPIVTPFDLEMAFNKERKFTLFHIIDYKQILPGGSNFIDFQQISELDISLLSGTVRNYDTNSSKSESNALVQKLSGAVEHKKTFMNTSSNTWDGLELTLGVSNIRSIEKGLVGLPTNYNDGKL